MICSNCHREAPDAVFCTWCGTRQASEPGDRPRQQFAAAPNESVVSLSVLTTLLPHLGERGVNEYRWAFGAGILVLLGLYVAGLITAAFIVAAILVPVVYVMYLYEVRIYRDAPLPVMFGTIGGGFVLGIVATIILDRLVGDRPGTSDTAPGSVIDVGPMLIAAVVVPLVQEIIKPLPALLLRNRPAFGQSIDGLTFGVAAGLGYAAAETVIHFSSVVTGLPVRSELGLWIFPLVSVAVLMPLLHGSTTGMITAALWRLGRRALPRLAWGAALAAVGGHVAFSVGGQVILAARLNPVVGLIWQALVVGILLVAVRVLLDRLLREEAAEMGLGRTTCGSCGSSVLAAGFCPVWVALGATPTSSVRSADAGLRGPASGATR